jgi:hypothetical protein
MGQYECIYTKHINTYNNVTAVLYGVKCQSALRTKTNVKNPW